MNGMNIKAKIALTIGVLVSMIVLLVALSVANLQILTATEPDSPAAGPGLNWLRMFWAMMSKRRFLTPPLVEPVQPPDSMANRSSIQVN